MASPPAVDVDELLVPLGRGEAFGRFLLSVLQRHAGPRGFDVAATRGFAGGWLVVACSRGGYEFRRQAETLGEAVLAVMDEVGRFAPIGEDVQLRLMDAAG